MSPRPRTAPALALALLVFLGATAPWHDGHAAWLPLAVGNTWNYVDEGDAPHLEEITEPIHVRGRHMYVRSYVGGPDDGLVNFWQLDTDGSVLLGGYFRASYPFGLVYEPPVRIFPGSPALGLEWTTHTVAWSIMDNVIFAEFDAYWAVGEHVTLSPPAGTFECFGVGQVAPPTFAPAPEGQAWGLDGRVVRSGTGVLGTGPASASEWYSDGVGLVKYDTGVPYLLQSYDLVTPAVASTWGRIKQLYP